MEDYSEIIYPGQQLTVYSRWIKSGKFVPLLIWFTCTTRIRSVIEQLLRSYWFTLYFIIRNIKNI